MKAVCKLDYGQFEVLKTYNFYYSHKDNFKRYFVEGQYGTSEFNKKQFDALFTQLNNKKQN